MKKKHLPAASGNSTSSLIGKLGAVDYRHYICNGITLVSLLLAIFVFKYAPFRIFEALTDLCTSFVYYISEVFDLGLHGDITVLRFSAQPLTLPFNLPGDFDSFTELWSKYWEAFKNTENIKAYFSSVGDFMYYGTRILTLLMPVILVPILLFGGSSKTNNDYNVNSKALKRFKTVERCFIVPVVRWCKDFSSFLSDNSAYLKLWALIWCYSFNLITIVIEAIAYYLYFIASFNLVSLYIQVLKLLMDISVMLNFLPTVTWFAVAYLVLNAIRRSIGFARLEHMENKDKGFINERPIVLMIVGTMGKKKTTILTDIALSQEVMFRDKAFEKILEADLKFPFFPWIIFENEIKKAMKNHSLYNLATAKRFVQSKKKKFERKPCIKNMFHYNFERYGTKYDNNLYVSDIWEVLEDYAQLYFIYVIQSSLIISNYSVRVDNVLDDLGNFPLWNSDFFRRDSRLIDAYSRHSHIIDFDMLRLGKKIIEDNPKANVFEFGVIDLTEIGKERGNMLELQHLKKNDAETNQKNDLLNEELKMIRHSATVDNYPFVKVITDEQRPESWGADARQLCEIVHIDDSGDLKLSMPLFALEELCIDCVSNKFVNKYYEHRFERGDNTLPMYLFHWFASVLYKYKKRIYNQFGFYKLKLGVEQGTQDGKIKGASYYLMCKKIYSKRFSTDCFSDFFTQKALRSEIGIDDLEEFKTEKATFDEMLSENSYFFNDLTKLM